MHSEAVLLRDERRSAEGFRAVYRLPACLFIRVFMAHRSSAAEPAHCRFMAGESRLGVFTTLVGPARDDF